MDYTCKPIVDWPDKLTPTGRRKRAPFSTDYTRTLKHLERELKHLGARNVVFQLALDESDIRIDGRPYASAKTRHPGVIVTFNSKHGPLSYWTDQYTDWRGNVRAISLALEALRAVDRHGVNKSGAQYQGYKRLGAAPAGAQPSAVNHAWVGAQFIERHSDYSAQAIYDDAIAFKRAYIQAAQVVHPDKPTGSTEQFQLLQRAASDLRAKHGIAASGATV